MSRVPELSRLLPLKCLAVAVLLGTAAFAASPVKGDRETYFSAANEPKMQDRLRELELFASSTETTDLKIHALELMSWYYKQLGAEAEANRWARQLLTFDAENPLGLSVLVENARRTNPTAISPENLSFAQRGLRRAERFEKPDGLPDAEFAQLRQRMLGILNGTLGYSFFQQKDYANARTYLRKTVTFLPDDTYYVYALGLANLEDKGGDASEGYWYLARAVNLTQGTPAGQQIADYAAARYRQAGGSESNWKQFLAAASAPVTPTATEPAVVASATPTANPATAPPSPKTAESQSTAAAATNQKTETASAPPPNSASSAVAPASRAAEPPRQQATARTETKPLPQSDTGTATASRPPTTQTSASSTAGSPATTATRAPATQPSAPNTDSPPAAAANNATEVAILTVPPPPVVQRPPLSPRDPVSLGILIEATIATNANRSAVIYALVDMLRHLRSADEAFILSFGQQLEFHQDLTQNYDLLEQAMSTIAPAEGAALLDAVGFSSGHLERIAKNRNRVLLVISDGRDFGSRTPAYETLQQIDQSGVRVYCIGVGAMDSGGRSRLQQLSSRSGGETTFVADPLHFRAAARQIAAGLGIEFPM